MPVLRTLTALLLVVLAGVSCWNAVDAYRASQSFIEPQTPLRLAFNLARVLVEQGIVVLAVARGERAGRLLRGVALLLVTLKLGFFLYLAPQYLPALQRWGLRLSSITVVLTYPTLGLALVQLVRDHRAFGRAAARASAEDH